MTETKKAAEPKGELVTDVTGARIVPVTIGRTVVYHPHEWEARSAGAGPWVAIVVAVTAVQADAQWVTLAVFPPSPTSVGTDPVQRHEAVKQGTEPGTWAWPERV